MEAPYVLMLEADADDRQLTAEYFDHHGIQVEFLTHSHDLILCLVEKYGNGSALPALVLLNVNSRPDDGLVVIQTVRAHEAFKHIPLIILGEHMDARMVQACYKVGANTVISKPSTPQLTMHKINSFVRYWFEVAELATATAVSRS